MENKENNTGNSNVYEVCENCGEECKQLTSKIIKFFCYDGWKDEPMKLCDICLKEENEYEKSSE